MKKYIYFFLLKFVKIHIQIDNELVAKKYSEGLDSILDLFVQISQKIKILEDDQRKLKKPLPNLNPIEAVLNV